jgi:hypothetical protein
MNYLRMDLKVCEGCGALWLRMCAMKGVYCRSCAAKLAEFPPPRVRRNGGKRTLLKRAAGCGAAGASCAGGAR